MIRASCLIASVVVLGCTPQSELRDTIPSPVAGEPSTFAGIVAVVGSAPMNVQVTIRDETGRSIRIVGPLADELRRLAGAEVSAEGTVSPSPDPMIELQMQATDYEIVSVDGEPVVMGEIVSVDAGGARLRTPSGEELFLSGAPADFRIGHKVWVQGPRGVAVQSYGTIRP